MGGQSCSPSDSEVHAALLEANGDRKTAAAALGVTTEQLKQFIDKRPKLKERWQAGVKAPTDLEKWSDKPLEPKQANGAPANVTPGKVAANTAATNLRRSMMRSFKSFGLPESQVRDAMALFDWGNKHLSQTIPVVNGCMVRMMIKLNAQFDANEEELGTLKGQESEARRKHLQEMQVQIADTIRKISAQASDASYKNALIEVKKKEARNAGRGKSKPGFPVLGIKADNVTIHEGKGA